MKVFDQAVPAAVADAIIPITMNGPVDYIAFQLGLVASVFGTSITARLQTTFDDETWWDIACLQGLIANVQKAAAVKKYIASAVRAAAVDGTLAADTIFDGFFGLKFRIKYTIVGAYTGNLRLTVEGHKTARWA